MMIFNLVTYSVIIAEFSVAMYWMRGAQLNYRAAAAYRRGDVKEGDKLRRRANRWNIGARSGS